MKKILIYVLTSNLHPYPTLTECSLQTWALTPINGIEILFYTSRPKAPVHPSVIDFPIAEGLFNMGRKTLLALAWALKNKDWDYMARVNSSCYVRQKILFDYVQLLPDAGVFEGVMAPKGDGTFYLWGGAQFIISRDVAKSIVENKSRWDHREMEDVAISKLSKELGISWRNGRACSINKHENHWLCIAYGENVNGSFSFNDLCEMEKASDQYFIRVKQDLNRGKDIEIMKTLYLCNI